MCKVPASHEASKSCTSPSPRASSSQSEGGPAVTRGRAPASGVYGSAALGRLGQPCPTHSSLPTQWLAQESLKLYNL